MELVTTASKLSINHILQKHWGDYLSKYKASIPQYVIDTVEKMLACRDPNKLGYHKYTCPNHPQISVIVPNSCKSRFCNTCGKVLTDKWVDKMCLRLRLRHRILGLKDSRIQVQTHKPMHSKKTNLEHTIATASALGSLAP